MEWRPIRTSALIFGIMFIVALAVVNALLYNVIPRFFVGNDPNVELFVTIIIAEIGAIGVFGAAIGKLVEDSPPPSPTVPADIHAETLEVLRLAIDAINRSGGK